MPAATPSDSADRGHDDRFDQKLKQDVPALCADGHAKPDFFVRSVTDTRRIFMMPMPPTISEIEAMPISMSIMVRLVPAMVLAISSMVRMVKSSSSDAGR